jgi:hypothetical protein
MACRRTKRHAADPRIPLLLFTLDGIEGPLEDLARGAGFRGALAKGEGIFALSQAIEELLQGNVRKDVAAESATEEARKKLKAIREPAA